MHICFILLLNYRYFWEVFSLKKIIFALLCILFICITFTILTSPKGIGIQGESASKIFKKYMDEDILFYERGIYVANDDYDWKENPFHITKGSMIGEVETKTTNTFLFRLFQNFTATTLEKGTEIYSTNKNSSLLVMKNGEYILYSLLVEG